MRCYLLTFIKTKPVHVVPGKFFVEEPWHTTISVENLEDADHAARSLGSALRVRLAKGYDIKLESIEQIS